MPPLATYTRLFADADGQSHFENLSGRLTPTAFAPPAGDLYTRAFVPTADAFWVGVSADWAGDVPHPAPRRQVFCTVRGEYEITASDGETRRFPAGSVLLLEDTHGEGHSTRVIGHQPVLVLGIALTTQSTQPGD